MSDVFEKLGEAIGRYSIEICRSDVELAPPAYLTAAMQAAEADRDAPVVERDALKAALRDEVIYGHFYDENEMVHKGAMCSLCAGEWLYAEPERHAPDCLAAP